MTRASPSFEVSWVWNTLSSPTRSSLLSKISTWITLTASLVGSQNDFIYQRIRHILTALPGATWRLMSRTSHRCWCPMPDALHLIGPHITYRSMFPTLSFLPTTPRPSVHFIAPIATVRIVGGSASPTTTTMARPVTPVETPAYKPHGYLHQHVYWLPIGASTTTLSSVRSPVRRSLHLPGSYPQLSALCQ